MEMFYIIYPFCSQWDQIKAPHALEERGREVGIESFNEQRVVSSTMPSHRLVRYAAKQAGIEASEKLYAILNEKHFIQGKRLNDRAMLLESAVQAGLDRSSVQTFLEGNEGEQEVLDLVDAVHQAGIHAIPTFVIDGKYCIQGAQRAGAFVDVFRKIESSEAGGEGGQSMFSHGK